MHTHTHTHTHTNSSGTSDPFVTVSLGQHSLKTEVIKKTLAPVWSVSKEFEEVRGTEMLTLKVY